MRIKYLLLILFSFVQFSYSQIVTSLPQFPTESDSITIFFDATKGSQGLMGETGDIYAHTGVITNASTSNSDWKQVIGTWGNNSTQPKLTRISTDMYKLVIGFPRVFYNMSSSPDTIKKLAFVFRNAGATKQTIPDIFYNLFVPGSYSLVLNSPTVTYGLGDLLRSPVFASPTDTINIISKAAALGTKSKDITLFINGVQKAQTTTDSLNYKFISANFTSGPQQVSIIGTDTTNLADTVNFAIMVNPAIVKQSLPAGKMLGINIDSPTTVTLALYAPYKSYVYVIGDFNDWKVDQNYFMRKDEVTADSVIWWLTFNIPTPGQEFAFQYFVDGNLRIADPYTEKILDPYNDKFIPTSIYPATSIQYPTGKTQQIVSILQTIQTPFNWQVTNFVKPLTKNLTIYELHIRDFVSTHSYRTLKDTLNYLKNLGINAIELMPVMEYEGNNSWGYNADFSLALDKYYGTKNELKSFIDAAHSVGIAVILDIVLNHTMGQSPFARLYWDSGKNRPAANNPWLNPVAKHDFNVGNDFNHESPQTKYFVDRVTDYWLTEYKIDGFRFDLSKGFTQKNTLGNVSAWGNYDQSRIDLLERMATKIRQKYSDAILILEHFADNSEETVLANFGFLLWGNMNYNYTEASMGYVNKTDLRWTSYKQRGWNSPNAVVYMESHDEERMMYKNEQFGNSNGSYNTKNIATGLDRVKLAATFFYMIPGPKMLWQFGELGYDITINQGGRTSPKPILWNYYDVPNRKQLNKTIAALIKLRTTYEAFSTVNFSLKVNNTDAVKIIYLNGDSMKVSIFGNFDVVTRGTNANFQHPGIWYDYFTGDSLSVVNPNAIINFAPGEYHIYTDVKLPTPDLGIITDIKKNDNSIITNYKLFQNYPNPFNPSTVISYQILTSSNVTLKVFDVLGREVATLVNREQSSGNYSVTFDASNLASGIYFYTLRAGDFFQTKKLILMK